MKNNLPFIPNKKCKGSLVFITCFFLAACIQEDENLMLRDHQNTLLTDQVETSSAEISALQKRTFTAHLTGANEVPAVESEGKGQAVFTLSEDGTELHYTLNVAQIDEVIMAHIHCGGPEENGPPVVFLFGPVPEGTTVNGVLAQGTISGVISRTHEACNGSISTFEKLMELLRSGNTYVNVHTVKNRGGEIRGQIK